MLREIRHSITALVKDRTFSLIASLTLAVAIGANSAIFSVIHAVLIAPMPYAAPDRLVVMYNLYPGVGVTSRGANSVPNYFDRRSETETFEHVALLDSNDRAVGAEGGPQQMGTLKVTPSFFPLLGAVPALGRIFTEDDATLGNERVAILTHGVWKQQYGGAADVVGKEIRIDRVTYQIVGVLPPAFLPPDPDAKILLPFAFTDEQKAQDSEHSNFATMLARLEPGVSLALAQQRIDALNDRRRLAQPQGMQELLKNAGFHTPVVFFKDELVRDVRSELWLVQGGVALMLAIGCVNIANLMLIRAQKRKRELAVRTALGAGRGRLVREMLTETLVLATAGGLAGVGLAWALTRSLAGFIAEQLPRGASVGLSPTVLAFTAGLSLVTGLFFGLIPALAALRSDPAQVLREAGRSGTAGRGAALTLSTLVVAQFSFAFVLLILAGLLVLSFRKVTGIEPGFATGGVLTARLSLPVARYADATQQREFAATLDRALAALPGVESVGLTTSLPFAGNADASGITIEGRVLAAGEGPPVPLWNEVSAGFFATLEIPLLAGSVFAETDTYGAARAVIVDQQFATRYFPAGDALGKRIRRGVGDVEG